MHLTRHRTFAGPRWAVDGHWLPDGFHLDLALQRPLAEMRDALAGARSAEPAEGALLAPIEDTQEVWAAGVTYLRSREARMAESETADIYDKVYEAERVEVFFKSIGWRVMGHGDEIRVRRDSTWNVPEPELALMLNRAGDIVGYTAGNDVSSRSIEGENPLYLPFDGETRTSQLKRSLEEIAQWLCAELDFPEGAFLMTGTGLVPPDEFSLASGDAVRIALGELVLENTVE